jgi:hypothetical protein
MKKWLTNFLLKFKLLDESTVVTKYLSTFKIYYLHIIEENGNSDAFIGGNETCSPEDLAAFILYNFSVSNSEDLIASIHGNKNSNIDGEKLLEAYIKMSQEKLQELMLGLSVNQEAPVDNSEEPVISPLSVYNNTKVLK